MFLLIAQSSKYLVNIKKLNELQNIAIIQNYVNLHTLLKIYFIKE